MAGKKGERNGWVRRGGKKNKLKYFSDSMLLYPNIPHVVRVDNDILELLRLGILTYNRE